MILCAPQCQGHGATFRCPISHAVTKLAAILCVDYSDVIHFRMEGNEPVEEAHQCLQESVLSWGNLLIATGGALKPSKCFYHLISFDWKQDGSWVYEQNDTRNDLCLLVPQPDDTLAEIEHLGVHAASRTLGSMTCPSGSPNGALSRVR